MIALAAIGLGLTAQPAKAGYIDLTTANSSGTINNALFSQGPSHAGTGIFPSFVEIGGANKNIVEGYNTTVNNVLDNGSSAVHNHEVLTSDLRITVLADGSKYFKFKLDINESTGGGNSYLSLDSLKIYTSTTPNQSTTNPNSLGTLRYDMGTGNGVKLDYNLEPGSGTSDLFVYIPVWTNQVASQYVYLDSKFGVLGVDGSRDYGNSDGFEEWALANAGTGETDGGGGGSLEIVPAPAGLILLVSGLPVLALRRMLRRKQAVA